MEALKACYADTSSDSDSQSASSNPTLDHSEGFTPLPPPPVSLLNPPNSLGSQDFLQTGQASRFRSFPHVDGNYALHVYIPICIPSPSTKELAAFLKKVSSHEPSLHAVDVDLPLNILCKNEEKLEQAVLGREFHISLGRTVPIRVHQIDSMVSMLRQKLQTQQRYWIDFSKWEVFVNDGLTRTFLSLEVVQGGLREITKQIEAVNGVYKLHNLPEFYKDPRPHISLAWALGDIGHSLKKMVEEVIKTSAVENSVRKCAFTCKFKVFIPPSSKKELAAFLEKVSSHEPSLNAINVDLPLNDLCKNEEKLEQDVLGSEFHIFLGRTVPTRVHQIDSMVSMLRQELQCQQQSVCA